MSAFRRGLLLTTILVPCAIASLGGRAAAQGDTIALDTIDVVPVTPVGGAGGIGRSETGARVPTGGSLPLSKVPFTVETVTARQFEQDRATLDPTFTLARTTPGVNVSDGQGNSFRQTVTYRGFDASPLQGAPQGLAVYQNGVRINEAFGDVVNWDLIPQVAINRLDIVTGNPIFGLNALGGAVNIEMKNGFTWQGKEVSVMGGSDGRILGTLQYGEVIGPWSFYFAGEGLRDRGWRFQSPSEIGRVYADLGHRTPDSEFHLIASGAKTFFGAAAAAPVDFTRLNERAIFTSPQTIDTEVGQIQVTGKVNLSPTWDMSGVAYVRRFSQFVVDGNDGNFENCSTRSSFRGFLCFEDDGFERAPGQSDQAFRNQFLIVGPQNQRIPFRAGIPYGTLDTVRTEATSYGGTLQATNRDQLFERPNTFIVGGSIDAASYSFKSASTLGVINPDLSVTTDPNNPVYGTIPGLGTGPIRTAAALGIAPSQVFGSNLYMGLYALDTLDVTDRLSLTAGARLNFARISTQDQTGFSPDVTGTHYFTRINPVAGLTYRFYPWLSLYGGYSESNRAPTPLELACANPDRPCLLPNSLVADPPLKQVEARTYEAGFRGTVADVYEGGLVNYKLGFFRTDLSNDILQVAVPGNAARGYFVNVPATQRQGIEVSAEYVGERLRLYANYALVDATFQFRGDLSSPNNPLADDGLITVRPGNKLPLIPEHQIKAGFDYAITPQWRFGFNVAAFSSSYFRGDESNLNRKLPAYALANLNTSFQITKNVEIFGLVTNLFNTRVPSFGTFLGTSANFANRYTLADPRTTTLIQPLSVYGGMRVTW
ncbi:TonB-dependent receptor [Methylobacterium isbiliense]|uniref:Vitamin B12 transporter BtuB n=1 Tax=Methylobacterium isbiliense TaxID=315478 RepID=A0ABQ4SCM8_9HYPH|nr:TonB-dependent receptor [Methylobacterium isbiliense]MDN3621932.1 TonB-dependent receptor [Methylobacterium isbiliense]GJD99554.1 Vitamin B12 transporter BtuB [Methylobacterium isbiliense]